MAKHKLNETDLKHLVRTIIRETFEDGHISDDYENDMRHLADVTGETMDDDFLDSVSRYDARNGFEQEPVYNDRKRQEMNADWHEIDNQTKDLKARYGKNAQALDNLNAFTDTIHQYLNDVNDNVIDDKYAILTKVDYDSAEKERNSQVENVIRKIVREAIISEMNPFEMPNKYGNTLSGQNPFSRNYGVNAHHFAHGGVDAEWARFDQDKMHKKEQQYMKNNTKRAMDAADKRPLHRKGSLNRAFDESKSNMNEDRGRYAFKTMSEKGGSNVILINDLNDIKKCNTPGVYYWEVVDYNQHNLSDPKSLIAWGGEGGYWSNIVTNENVKPEIKEYVLSKRKDNKVGV